VSMTVTFSF